MSHDGVTPNIRESSAATTPVEPTREETLEAALWQIVNNAEAWHGDDAAKGRALAIIALTGRTALNATR